MRDSVMKTERVERTLNQETMQQQMNLNRIVRIWTNKRGNFTKNSFGKFLIWYVIVSITTELLHTILNL